jgi:hypothetical protein
MTSIATGGKAIYGAPLGILMLDARFPRIPGDIENAGTRPFPVLYRVVKGATPARVVLDAAEGLLPAFLEAAADLGAEAHYELWVPVAVPAGPGRACPGAGGDECADPGAILSLRPERVTKMAAVALRVHRVSLA